jgi:hypothetical protein
LCVLAASTGAIQSSRKGGVCFCVRRWCRCCNTGSTQHFIMHNTIAALPAKQ